MILVRMPAWAIAKTMETLIVSLGLWADEPLASLKNPLWQD